MSKSRKLSPLPGTADAGLWTANNEFGTVNYAEAVFPLLRRKGPKEAEIVGTGFYVLPNGCFLTARHVLEDPETLFAIQLMADRTYHVRTIQDAFHHPTGDISVGVFSPLVHRVTGASLMNVTVPLAPTQPGATTPIATYSYPLHEVRSEQAGVSVNLQPDFYHGHLGEYYAERGPSGRLACPYYMADLHLYGASSGGPVVSSSGPVFAIASASYDGANDLAFLTPVSLAGDITIPKVDMKDGHGAKTRPFRDILNTHFKKAVPPYKSSL